MYNTVTNNEDIERGLNNFYSGLSYFYSAPSIINSSTVGQDRPYAELEALADYEMHNGRGIRRYDGSWVSPDNISEVLDSNLYRDDLMRITYDQNSQPDVRQYDIANNLGWLRNPNEDLKNYIEASDEKTKQIYYNLLDGKSKEVIDNIQNLSFTTNDALNRQFKGRFTLMQDEEGNPYWQEVLTDGIMDKKLEAAGISLVNTYGRKKYSDGVITSGVRSLGKAVADIAPTVLYVQAALEDLGEATSNWIQGNGFKSEYDRSNAIADETQEWLDNSLIGRTSYQQDEGITNSWEGFISGLGQGAGSLLQFGMAGRVAGTAGRLVGRATRGLARNVARHSTGKLAEAARTVQNTLTRDALRTESLGAIGSRLNKVLFESPQSLPMWSAGITLNFGEAYNAAKEAGLPLEDAASVGFITGILNTAVENIMGANVLTRYLVGEKGATQTAKAIINEVGGDVKKLYNKATSDQVSRNVIQKVTDQLRNVGRVPVLGSMLEEGGEEIVQSFVKNAVENLYDNWIAPANAEEGKGLFNTDWLGRDEVVGALEEGLIGGILGGLGGFVNSRSKENESIIPFIANGDSDIVKAGAELALQRGAITKEQRDGIIQRVDVLDQIRKVNQGVFIDVLSTTPAQQLEYANKALQVLRDQHDYATSQTDTSTDAQLNDNKQFRKIVSDTIDNINSLSGLRAFADQLEVNGKQQQARQIRQRIKESEKEANSLFKNKKATNNIQRIADQQAKIAYAKHLYTLKEDIDNADTLTNILNKKLGELSSANQNLTQIPTIINQMSSIQQSNARINTLIEEYEKPDTNTDRKKSIRNQIVSELSKQNRAITSNKAIKSITGFNDYVRTLDQINQLQIGKRLTVADLDSSTSEGFKQGFDEIRNQVEEHLKEAEVNKQGKKEATNDSNKQQQQEASTPTNEIMETEYATYKNQLQTEENPSEERRAYIDNIINGDEETQVNSLQQELSRLTKQMNDTPSDQRGSVESNAIRQEIRRLRNLISYLKRKYDISKTEADKNRRFKSELAKDDKVYRDSEGNRYIVDNPSTQYSENEGMVYRIAKLEEGQDRNDAVYQEYTEANDREFLTSLIDENGESFSTKVRQDKRITALNARKVKKDLNVSFEPTSEAETKSDDSQKEVVTKINAFSNKLKGLPVGDKFKERLADPRMDSTKFTGKAVAYIWDKASQQVKKAKAAFDSYRASNKKWSDLTQEQKDQLLDYLPVQLVLNHPYLSDKDGNQYDNIVSIPARKSATSERYKMDEDQVEQRARLIEALLSNGEFDIKQGDIEIQPGYFNINTDFGPTTFMDEYGVEHPYPDAYNGDLRETESLGITEENGKYYIHSGNRKQEVVIGIAGETGVIYYQDPSGNGILMADGHGSPGTPYLIIPGFLNLNNKSANYPLKLNPRRIDRNTATLIARLMQALAKGYATKSLTLESLVVDLPKDLFNIQTEDKALTVGDLLEDLIYWGNRTRQNDPDPSLNKEYLRSKQLYIDFRKGQVRYGSKETILGDSEEEMNKFINWIVNNKSFSIDRGKIFNHQKMQYTYSIEGGYSSVRDRDYVANLLDNRVVTTNLNAKGPLFKGQFIRLKTIRSTAPVNPVETPKPTTAKTDEPKVEIIDTAPQGVVKAVRQGGKITGAKVVKAAIAVAKPGTTLTVRFTNNDASIYDENDNRIGDLNKIQFNVENGSINGITVKGNAAFTSEDGVQGAIIKAIKQVYPKADILSTIAEVTVIPPVQPATQDTSVRQQAQNQEIKVNPRVDEVFKSVTDKLRLKFKTKPSKADIDGFLTSLVNKTTNIAKLYGFKDYAEARVLSQAVGSNGKTLEQNLIEFMNNIGSESTTAKSNKIEEIAATVFKIPEKFTKGATRLVSAVSETERITDKEKKRLDKILGRRANSIEWVDDFIKVLDYAGNPAKAYGITTRTATQIYTGAASGTGLHEAFHNVSLFNLTNEQRQQMYDEARKQYSQLRDSTNQEVEEFLADKFMQFALEMMENNKVRATEYKGLAGFFKRMWDWVLRQIGFRPSYQDINTLFRRIYDGQYSRVRTNKESLVYFDNTYGKDAKVPLTINGVTLNMDSRTLDKVVTNLTAQLLYDNDITSLESVKNGIDLSAMLNQMRNLVDAYSSIVNTSEDFNEIEQASKLVNVYTEIVDNWDTVFKPLIENKLQSYGIRRRQEDNTFTIDEDLKNLINDEVTSAWEINSKHNAKAEVRMLFLALPKTSQRDPVTGLIQYENPDVVWYNTISRLHNCTSFENMMEQLQNIAKETNTISGIEDDINPYNTLYSMLRNSNQTLQTQFFITMKKHRNRFINFTFNEDGNGLDINISDADINKRTRQINQFWSKQFGQSGLTTETRKKQLAELQDKYDSLLKEVTNSNTTYEQNLQTLLELLAGINVTVDTQTIENILTLPTYKSDNKKVALNKFIQSNSFSGVFSKRGKSLLNNIIKDRIDVDKLANALYKESLSRVLAESYVKMNPTSEDDSVPGPGGNLVYSYSDNNSITSMFCEWLKDEDYVNQLLDDPYCSNSLWLKQLTDPNVRKKIGVKTMLALMNKDNYSGSRGYLDISDNEDLIIKMQATLSSNMPLPSLANKKSYYFVSGLDKQIVKLIVQSNGEVQVSDRIIDIFAGYAQDEINAIVAADLLRQEFVDSIGITVDHFNELSAEEQQNLIQSNEQAKHYYSQLVENYHFKLNGGKMLLSGNGYNFRYFRELQNRLEASSIADVIEFTNTEEFRNSIRRYINQNINNTIKLFIDSNIINYGQKFTKQQQDKLNDSSQIATSVIIAKAYNYLPMIEVKGKKVMLDTQTSIAQAIADYAINTAISTIEFEKILSGDLAFYKSKSIEDALDDRVKRYSALTSTRQVMNDQVTSNEDYEVDFDTKHYRSATLATNKSRLQDTYDMLYERYVGTEDNPGLLYQRFIDFAENEVEGYVGKSREELYNMAQQDAERRLSGYLSNDPTDAQVWISPKMFRKLAIMNGEWNKQKEQAYQLLMSGNQLTVEQELEASALVMQPLKYVHYGFRFNEDGLKIPIYDKMSLSTLYPSTVNGTRMKPLYDWMMQNDVDMVKMDSAVKSGNTPKQPYLDQDGNVNNLDNMLVYSQEFKYIGKQLVTDPHEIENTTLLTQFLKIVVSNLDLNGDYQLDGKTVKGNELLQQYNDAIINLSDRGVEKLKKRFGYKDGKVNKRKIVEMLHDMGLQTNVPQNLLDALKYSDQAKDYYIELSAIPSLNWIQSRLISLFSKEAIDITIPGNAFYQTTSFGMDFTDAYRKLVGDNTVKRYNDKLRFRNENGRMEVKLSINLFRGVIPTRYKTFEEQRKYILANKELFAFAYRVPTQGMNSTLPIEIVDVLPSTSGDVIFLPLEITTLTGSDFDIDKMYLARYNYYDDNGTLRKVEFIDENDYDSKEEFLEAIWHSRYGYVNQQNYLSDRDKVLGVLDYVSKQVGQNGVLSEEDKIDLLKLSQDYSKYISRNRIVELLSNGEEPFDMMNSIRAYINSKLPLKKDVVSVNNFIRDNINKSMWELNSERAVQNRLLQIFSSTLTSPNHFIDATTPLDVTTAPLQAIAKSMKKYFEVNGEMQDLGPLFPAYQESMKAKNTGADNGIGPMALINVFRTFMQMSDLHLVGVTDDNGINIVQELGIDNLNKVFDNEGLSILDWTSALINAHVDAAKDPYIIRLNVNKYTYNMTAFMISAGFGRSTFYFLPQPILRDLATRYMHQTSSDIGVEAWERYSKKYMNDTIEDYESMIDKGQPTRVPLNTVLSNIRNIEWLEKQLSTPENQRDNTWYATQLTILDVYNSLSTYADAIRDCINAVQIDTKKFGTNANELIQFQHLIEKVLNNPLIANPQDLFDKTFLRRKYNNSIKLLFDLFSDQILDFSPEFINIVEELQKYTKTYYSRNVDKINSIANEVKTSIYAHFFNQYLTDHDMSVKDLFFGDKSIVNRVARLQEDIASGKYRELADNEFIKMLLPNVLNNDQTPMSFENSITKQRDTDSKNAYTFSWMDLLEHEDPEIRKLGTDLIVYSFYLGGGLQSGIYNFYDLAPYGYLANLQLSNGETFQQYMKKILVDFNTQVGQNNSLINEIYEDVFRNSWRNNDIIPEFKLNSKVLPIKVQNDGKQITYIKFPPKANSFLKTQNGTYRPFVRLANTGNPNTTNIYRLVGYFADPNRNEIQLVYGRANKLGYSYQGFKIKESGTTQLPSNIGEEFTNPTQESFTTKFIDGDIFVPVQPFSGNSIDSSIHVEETITPEGDTEVINPIIGQDQMTQEQFDQAMEQDFNDFVAQNLDLDALNRIEEEGKRIKEQCKGK